MNIDCCQVNICDDSVVIVPFPIISGKLLNVACMQRNTQPRENLSLMKNVSIRFRSFVSKDFFRSLRSFNSLKAKRTESKRQLFTILANRNASNNKSTD
jgi:hypothetical protein